MEMIARASEHATDFEGKVKPGFGWLKAAYSALAEWLRAHGFNIRFTDAELGGILARAQRGLEIGKTARVAFDPTNGPLANAKNSGLRLLDCRHEVRCAVALVVTAATAHRTDSRFDALSIREGAIAEKAVGTGDFVGGHCGGSPWVSAVVVPC
jgi:hypothetical protein